MIDGSTTLEHGASFWHEIFMHNDLDWVTAGWIVVVIGSLVGVIMILKDWDEKLVSRPNKRLEEWRAKQWTGDDPS